MTSPRPAHRSRVRAQLHRAVSAWTVVQLLADEGGRSVRSKCPEGRQSAPLHLAAMNGVRRLLGCFELLQLGVRSSSWLLMLQDTRHCTMQPSKHVEAAGCQCITLIEVGTASEAWSFSMLLTRSTFCSALGRSQWTARKSNALAGSGGKRLHAVKDGQGLTVPQAAEYYARAAGTAVTGGWL